MAGALHQERSAHCAVDFLARIALCPAVPLTTTARQEASKVWRSRPVLGPETVATPELGPGCSAEAVKRSPPSSAKLKLATNRRFNSLRRRCHGRLRCGM